MGYVNGAAAASVGAASSLSYSHSLSAGSNRTVVVSMSSWRDNATSTLSSITYDGQTCTIDRDQNFVTSSQVYRAAISHLPDASLSGSGSKTVVVTMGQSTDEIASTVQAYDGIDQSTGPVRSGSPNGNNTANETEANRTASITCQSGDLVIACIQCWDDTNDGSRTMNGQIRQQANGSDSDQTNCWSNEETSTGTSVTVSSNFCTCIAGLALVPSGGATLEQEGFRWYNDDEDENSSTPAADQDADITAPAEAVRRLRMIVNATGDPDTQQYKLQFRKVGDSTWQTVQ
jgi:hypothetical protein